MPPIDADTSALMTAEELAAINDTPSDAELDLLKAVAGDEPDDEDDDEGAAAAPAPAPASSPAPAPAATPAEATAAPPAATPAAPAEAPAAEPAAAPAEAAPAAASTPSTAPAPVPTYKADLPADFDARKQAAADKEAAAWAAFRNGEIQQDALQTQLTEVAAERADLQKLETKVEISKEMSAQTAEQQWQHAVATFIDGAKSVVDYSTDAKRAADLDLFVRSLANDPANADKGMSWFLEEAHKRVLALHNIAPAPAPATAVPTPAPAQAPAAPAPAPASRKPDTTGLPPSLAQVPGSDGPGDVGGEFADIDKLSGLELEDAIRRMTPAQRERYGRGQ